MIFMIFVLSKFSFVCVAWDREKQESLVIDGYNAAVRMIIIIS